MSVLSTPAAVIALIALSVGAGHLYRFARQRTVRTDLYFGLLCIFVAMYGAGCAGLYAAAGPEMGFVWQRLRSASLATSAIALLWFVREQAGWSNRAWIVGLTTAWTAFVLLVHLNPSGLVWSGEPVGLHLRFPFGYDFTLHLTKPGPLHRSQEILGLLTFGTSFYAGAYLWRERWRRRGSPLLVGSTLLIAALLSDAAVTTGTYFGPFTLEYALTAFLLFTTYSLSGESADAAEIRGALRESEQLYRTLFETMLQGVVYLDRAGRILSANPAAERILGIDLPRLRGMSVFDPVWEMRGPDGHAVTAESHPAMTAIRTGRAVKNPALMRITSARDGAWRWLEVTAIPLARPGRGEIDRVYAVLTDTSDQRRSDLALRQSEDRFRSIVHGSPMAMFMYRLEPDGRLVLEESNPAADRITGVAAKELVGKTLEEAFPLLRDTAIPHRYRLAASEGIPWHTQDLKYEDERIKGAFDVHAFQTSPGRMAVLFLEITDRKRAEAALTRSEKMFRSYFKLGLIGMAVASPARGWVEVNERLCEMLGRSRDELMETAWPELVHPEDGPADHEAFERMLLGEIEDYFLELRFLRKDGSVVFTEVFVTCVRRSDGTVEFVIVHLQDVTLRKRAERQLLQSQKMEAVGQLAGGVAHDFNNLLQAIQGYTEVSLARLPADHRAHGYMLEVKRAAERAAMLTQQLLTFSRRDTLKRKQIDLREVIADLMKMLRRVIGAQVELEVRSDPDLREVFADPVQVEQVLMNLCINARDAMPGGGTLTIVTANVTFDAVFCLEHPWAEPGEYVELTVADTGEGIPRELQARVFEPFYTTKDVGQGTGLGLATVYAIIENHDGMIDLTSEPGRGTAFRVYLPFSEGPPARIRATEVKPEVEGGRETILVAEDDDLVRQLAETVLSEAGYALILARDGAEAIDLFREHADEIDLAILDVIMPKKGGGEVFKVIRAKLPDLPILFSSGYGYGAVVDHLPDGAGTLIAKPYSPRDLLIRVREILNG